MLATFSHCACLTMDIPWLFIFQIGIIQIDNTYQMIWVFIPNTYSISESKVGFRKQWKLMKSNVIQYFMYIPANYSSFFTQSNEKIQINAIQVQKLLEIFKLLVNFRAFLDLTRVVLMTIDGCRLHFCRNLISAKIGLRWWAYLQ